MQQQLSISSRIPDNQYKVGQTFYEMKVKITPGSRSVQQSNSDFINKVEANNLILPLPDFVCNSIIILILVRGFSREK